MKVPDLFALRPGFLARWDGWYPDVPPVGFLLREHYTHRWLRVHMLAEAKRDPASGWDYAELGRRYNAVADYVLGDKSSCALLILHQCNNIPQAQLAEARLDASRLADLGHLPRRFWDEDDGVFATPMCLRGAGMVWHRGVFDAFFSSAAQGRIKGLLAEEQHGQVVAPYDGGADLLFASTWERDQARERFFDWTSARTDGL